MRRWLFNLTAAASLVLCLATAVLWVRSYWVSYTVESFQPWSPDDVKNPTGINAYVAAVSSSNGRIQFVKTLDSMPPGIHRLRYREGREINPNAPWFSYSAGNLPTPAQWNSIVEGSAAPVADLPNLMLPFWFVFLIFLPLSLIFFRRLLRRRQFGPDCCRTCGYDLTGNTSGVCPECGTAIEKARTER